MSRYDTRCGSCSASCKENLKTLTTPRSPVTAHTGVETILFSVDCALWGPRELVEQIAPWYIIDMLSPPEFFFDMEGILLPIVQLSLRRLGRYKICCQSLTVLGVACGESSSGFWERLRGGLVRAWLEGIRTKGVQSDCSVPVPTTTTHTLLATFFLASHSSVISPTLVPSLRNGPRYKYHKRFAYRPHILILRTAFPLRFHLRRIT